MYTPEPQLSHHPLTFAIVSGKGGVGKSITAVNLAEALARLEVPVALIDADIGHCATPILMNETPEHVLLHYALDQVPLEEALQRTLTGVTLLVSTQEPELTGAHEAALYQALDTALHRLRQTHRVLLIDAPAGSHENVRWALDRADAAIIPLVDEPTAIADAYRLVKQLWGLIPEYPIYAIVNFADTEAEAKSVITRFSTITEHFMGKTPEYLGWIPFSPEVRQSVTLQHPVGRKPGPVRNTFDQMAKSLLKACNRLQYASRIPSIPN